MEDPVDLEPRVERAEKASKTARVRSYLGEGSRFRWLVLGLAAVVVLLAVTWNYFSARESTDDAQIEGHIIPVSAKVGGTVLAVNVKDNQYVEAGTVLVKIDPADYQIAFERAQADLAAEEAAAQAAETAVPIRSTTAGSQVTTAGANVQNAEAGVEAAQKQVEAAKARLNSAQARVRQAQADDTKTARDLDRMKQLVARDEVSQQQYDAAVAAAEASRAGVESAEASVAEAEQGIAMAQSQLLQARARVAQAQAEVRSAGTASEQVSMSRAQAAAAQAKAQQMKAAVNQAQLNLQYTTAKAPTAGVVSRKSVEVGQIVQPGQPLLAIVPLDDMWVTANFKETQLRNMRPGKPALIAVDAFGGRKFKGHVESLAAATGERFSLLPPENAAGNYVKVVQRVPVKIVFEKGEDPEHLLRPGMSATPTVITR
jgi:membrane fusion protein, multidrug efflux system